MSNIHLRTGCFCNTGDCQKHLGLSNADVLSNVKAGHVCGDNMDIINGKPTGSVRVSFGYMSTFMDAQKFLQFLDECFLVKTLTNKESLTSPKTDISQEQQLDACKLRVPSFLTKILIYPVKSCASFSVYLLLRIIFCSELK